MSKNNNVLDVKNISKFYDDLQALDGVSFACKPQEFLTIFGPSGAGKTTILEAIAGVKDIDGGDIVLDGHIINDVPVQKRNVAMVFENYALYPHLTVAENIAFPLRSPNAPDYSEQDIKGKVQKIADELEIGMLLDRNPAQLSNGQKQRVSLARALVRDADIYLLDEPIAHLDAKLRSVARANLKAMCRDLGATILYVTHDFREALGLSDRVIIINEGKILQIGTPREIYQTPATDYVGHLLGDPAMNFADGIVQQTGKGITLETNGISIPIPTTLHKAAKKRIADSKEQTRFAIRPDGITIHTSKQKDAVAVKIYTVEHRAESLLVYALIGGYPFGGLLPLDSKVKTGQNAWITFDAKAGFLFDATFDIQPIAEEE